MTIDRLSLSERKYYIRDVCRNLIKNHGKQKYYNPYRVIRASKQVDKNIDWHCWAMCVFCSQSEFDIYHDSIAEECDYNTMQERMAYIMTDGLSSSFTDGDSWIDWSDSDWFGSFDMSD